MAQRVHIHVPLPERGMFVRQVPTTGDYVTPPGYWQSVANARKVGNKLMYREWSKTFTQLSMDYAPVGVTSAYAPDDKWTLLVVYKSGAHIYVKRGTGSLSSVTWYGADVLWDNTTPETAVFLNINGNVRISGKHGKNVWAYFAIPSRERFNNHAGYKLAGTYFLRSRCRHPVLDKDNTTPTSYPISAYLQYLLGFTVSAGGSGGKFVNGDKVRYGFNYEYDGVSNTEWSGQNSIMSASTHETTITADGQKVTLALYVYAPSFHERITGINIWRSINGGDWYFWRRVDINNGVLDDSGTQRNWSVSDVNYVASITGIVDDGRDLVESYMAMTSYTYFNEWVPGTPDSVRGTELSTECTFKAACVARQYAIVGSVDKYGHLYSDRIYISVPGWFDCFPDDRFLELGAGDGDSITALAYADGYLYVFKSRNTYVVDMGGPTEESWQVVAHHTVGAYGQKSVVNVPGGVVAASHQGVYLVRPDRVIELSEPVREVYTNQAAGYELLTVYDQLNNEVHVCRVGAYWGSAYVFSLDGAVTTRADMATLLGIVAFFLGPKAEVCEAYYDSPYLVFQYHTGAGPLEGMSVYYHCSTGIILLHPKRVRGKVLRIKANPGGYGLYYRFGWSDSFTGTSDYIWGYTDADTSYKQYEIQIPYHFDSFYVKVSGSSQAKWEIDSIIIEAIELRDR